MKIQNTVRQLQEGMLKTMDDPGKIAVDFLRLVIDGQIDHAYDKYVDFKGKHHNVYTAAGFSALKEGMMQNEIEAPNKTFDIKEVIKDDDMVAVFSHLVMKPGDPGMSVVHRFRIKQGKIIEMWDIGQMIPKDSPNNDGTF